MGDDSTIGNMPIGVALISRSHLYFGASGTSRRGSTVTFPASLNAATAALDAPPAPRITTILPAGSKPPDASAASTPCTSVLSPVHLPSRHHTVFTAPAARASGV